MCYDEGIFQQIIDGEYEGDLEEVEKHIANCEICKSKFEKIKNAEIFVSEKLNKELRECEMRKIDIEYHLFKFYKKEEKGRKNMNKKVKKLAAAAAALTIVLGSMSYQPVRAKAADFLNIFRANKIEGISITNENINKIQEAFNEGKGKMQLDDFMYTEVKSKEEVARLSKGEISKENVKKYKEDAELIQVNDSLEYGFATIHPESDVTLKFNVAKVNDFLTYLGEDAKLPKEIDQKEFVIHCGKSITYGINDKGDKNNNKYINVMEIGTPTLTLPDGINSKEMTDTLLSLKLLPNNIKQQLSSIGDLTNTLPVPFSENEQTKTDITIKGQKAILIKDKNESQNFIRIVFKKGDSLFNVSAKGYSSEELIKLLETME